MFVAGFMSEGMSEYFTQNARELVAIGVPRKAIHFIYPSSGETIEGNAAAVRTRFLEFADCGEEKLVVIAHSRGACDTLAFALENPEFRRQPCRGPVPGAGPFGGTGVADYLTGEGPPIDSSMPLKQRLIALGLGRLEEYRLSRGKHRGLPSLTPQASKKYWETAVEKHGTRYRSSAPRRLHDHQKEPRRVSTAPASDRFVAGSHFGPNDGIVVLEDQSVAGMGTVLAVLDAGHTDLTHRFPAAVPRRRLRQALIDAIIMGVGRPARTSRKTRATAHDDHRQRPNNNGQLTTDHKRPRHFARLR